MPTYTPRFDTDREDMVQRAIDAGVTRLFLPNIDEDTIASMHDLVASFPEYCFPMIGAASLLCKRKLPGTARHYGAIPAEMASIAVLVKSAWTCIGIKPPLSARNRRLLPSCIGRMIWACLFPCIPVMLQKKPCSF